jgi:hypothetical protein
VSPFARSLTSRCFFFLDLDDAVEVSEGPGELEGEESGGVVLVEGAVELGEFAEEGRGIEPWCESEFEPEESGEPFEGLTVVVVNAVIGTRVRIVGRDAILLT